ncbi:MAG: flagellar motor switch protein FliG [Nitrospirae bacterium]|nr:flagellar motor switch protein FliG [Nitrospirota bacterium]
MADTATENALSGIQKAALFLLALGEEAASNVLRHLSSRDVFTISSHMMKLTSASPTQVAEVIREFGELTVANGGFSAIGGEDYIQRVLENALGREKAEQMLESIQTETNSLESLNWLDPKTLAGFLRHEHPQTIAIILSYLDPPLASQVLPLLREDNVAHVVLRMATIDQVPANVVRDLGAVLKQELLSGGSSRTRTSGGIQAAADVLNYVDGATEENILAEIERVNADLAENIRKRMFLFEDLIKLDNKGVQEILKEIGRDVLAIALKGTEPAVRDLFFRNMSERASVILKEDMEDRGAVRVSEVESAQAEILRTVKSLGDQGRIILGGGGAGGDALIE